MPRKKVLTLEVPKVHALPKVRDSLDKAEQRRCATIVYRALVDVGASGIYRDSLAEKTGLSPGQVLEAVVWMRAHGVDIEVREGTPAARVTLKRPIPESWAPQAPVIQPEDLFGKPTRDEFDNGSLT